MLKVEEIAEEKAMVKFLERFSDNPFCVKFKNHEYMIGEGQPAFTVKLNRAIPMAELLKSTSLALGEAYMQGDLDIEGNLYEALDHFLGQMGKFSTDENALKKLMFSSTAKSNQKQEVTSHYDIGNDFYKLWLDETLSYSCGYFLNEEDSLYQAQLNKIDYTLEKLCLKEGMSLLDIGCGWGYLLIEAAKKYKVHGMGITLSKEQYKEFQKRIEEEGLQEYLTVVLMDYRDLPKYGRQFDRIVSIGMLEHVGRDNYRLYMECANQVLKPGGVFLLHFISALQEHPGDPWIKKYIFPGGVVPSLREMMSYMGDYNFHTLDVENLRLHYNRTLLKWLENFEENLEEIKKMFDETFIRMWRLYLSACAATFHNGIIDIHQILMTKGVNNELPSIRWYGAENKREE
ncbi:SAM-dependent methyltransferase [Hespellia stercorisuis]|uniref:Cyclopropane-fatty-acyl-phospholipid synthase n=1 Tax=Hespellia stercorisuis DSM 15480 TaxID=1121950 RepID=A0A1M6QWD5_9FIRM|nr:cyclopropane-fatty-acyl-phospholipid synthase family protein [Hespellia stercorisuis]SHK24433.1 cyclopropane-fatty-acyl-phospholipid synthase [Hespellia stercorisuis DSM 15480]